MNGKTTDDYIAHLYSVEDELNACPHVREFRINREDSRHGQKTLCIIVRFASQPPSSILEKLERSAKELCMMAVHVQRFHIATYTFHDAKGALIAYQELM